MEKELSRQPIGIYDSGIGGLTVAHAIAQHLPKEDIIYFGDTAHLPYGEKSEDAIQSYSIRITNFLLKKKCKVIIIACHSASSACYRMLPEYVGHRSHIINVIDPMATCLDKGDYGRCIGLIGTKRTVLSEVHYNTLCRINTHIKALATPLLAPMIEEGFIDNTISYEVIARYLSDPALAGITCLILGCTHYPMIKKEINRFYQQRIPLLDPSEEVAAATATYLATNRLLNDKQTNASRSFFVSDYTPSFEACTRLFFGETIPLRQYRIE